MDYLNRMTRLMTDTISACGDAPRDLDGHAREARDMLQGQAAPVVNGIYGDAGSRLLDGTRGSSETVEGAASPSTCWSAMPLPSRVPRVAVTIG